MTDSELITAAYNKMYAAMIAKDIVALDEVLDDSMVLVHMTGLRQSKREYLKSIADGTLNYYLADTDELRINCNENEATLVGKSRVDAAVYGGGKMRWRLCLAMRLVKRDGDWKFTSGKASTY